jgi:membrane protein YdbS with pleckstrin-like domain
MNGSVILPWLLFGPLFLMMGGHVLWIVTGWPWSARVAIGALIWVLSLFVVFGVGHWWRYRKPPASTGNDADRRG